MEEEEGICDVFTTYKLMFVLVFNTWAAEQKKYDITMIAGDGFE